MNDSKNPGATEKRTLVEEGTTFKGSLTSTCPILVKGGISGDLEAPSLTVATTGTVSGRMIETTRSSLTVMDAAARLPSTVAVTNAVPVAIAVTTPDPETVTTSGALDAHVTFRPRSVFAAASASDTVSSSVCPTGIVTVAGASVTFATGTTRVVTVTSVEAESPSLVAVIVAVPAASPVTSPSGDTETLAESELVQSTSRSVSTWPFASSTVAASCRERPMSSVAVTGVTATDATGRGTTVKLAVPRIPLTVAITLAKPAAAPVTTPAALTVATGSGSHVQVGVPMVIGALRWSKPVAVAAAVWPTWIVSGEIETSTRDRTGVVDPGAVGLASWAPPPPHAARIANRASRQRRTSLT